MKKNHMKHFDLDLYQETLPNGLLINVIPKSGNNIYATFVTKYGSFDNCFIPHGKKNIYESPMGVAHFLEHKVFEQKDGEDPFAFYTKNGADANASTSYLRTSYLFSGPSYVEENLEYLLDFVQDPYFTDENVEKEKGIIEQEIKMYEDIPYWKLYEKNLFNTFFNHPLRYPIAGTVESISKITKEDLYTCYDTFYHPSNMFLTVVGNVDPKVIIDCVKKNQAKKTYEKRDSVVRREIEEPDEVFQVQEEITGEVEIPKLSITYKINAEEKDINRLKKYLSFLFDLRLGSTSLLNERLKKENAITGTFGIDILEAGNHVICMVSVDSKKPEYVLKEVEEEMKNQTITEEELTRKKKTLKSACIYQSDSVYSICEHVNNQLLHYGEIILDEYEWIDSFNEKEAEEFLSTISFKNHSAMILNRK